MRIDRLANFIVIIAMLMVGIVIIGGGVKALANNDYDLTDWFSDLGKMGVVIIGAAIAVLGRKIIDPDGTQRRNGNGNGFQDGFSAGFNKAVELNRQRETDGD